MRRPLRVNARDGPLEVLRGAVRDGVHKIEQGKGEIEAIVCEVIDFARPVRLERAPFPGADLLRSTVEDLMIRPQADAASVTIVVDSAQEEFDAAVDALKVKQALVNLGRNAIEASSAGGRVVLRATRASRPKETVRFEVEDEGSGILSELGDKNYLPFATSKLKGVGLGLPVVRRIADVRGGTVRLEPRSSWRNERTALPMIS